MKYVVVLLVLMGFSLPAFAEEIPVEIQTPNDIDLIITGMMEIPTKEDPLVTIIIENEIGYPILLAQVSPDKAGYFSLDIKRHGPLWDNITEFFVKAITADAISDVVIKEPEYGVWNVGKIIWKEAAYRGFENDIGTIQVTDQDLNKFSNAIDFLRVKVWSDSSQHQTTMTLTETGMNTGVFEADILFSNTYHFSRGVLFVSRGDTVTAMYEDTTLPDDINSDVLKVNATALIVGQRGPPMERAPAYDLKMLDINNEPITGDAISVNQQVRLVSDLENHQDRSQPFAYLVQILNQKNQVEMLSWITGNLTSSQKLSPSVTWIPFKEGMYTATVFVWESVYNPTALSPPLSMEIDVKNEK